MELNTLTRTLLFDTYGEMLSEKQRLCVDLHYNQDLSLSEIGELENISRQAVRDNIIRAEAIMLELESKIGAVRRTERLEQAAELLESANAECESTLPDVSEKLRLAITLIKE